jgi:hypothetical protein
MDRLMKAAFLEAKKGLEAARPNPVARERKNRFAGAS